MSTSLFHSFVVAMDRIHARGRSAAHLTVIDEREQRLAEAMRLLESGQWQRAFKSLAGLADAGHPQAARVALLLVRRGSRLFGGSFRAGTQQQQCWMQASDHEQAEPPARWP